MHGFALGYSDPMAVDYFLAAIRLSVSAFNFGNIPKVASTLDLNPEPQTLKAEKQSSKGYSPP